MTVKFSGDDLQLRWSHSDSKLFRKCPRAYKWAVLDGWQRRPGAVGGIRMDFGKIFHRCMEEFDRAIWAGKSRDEALYRAFVIADTFGPTLDDVLDAKSQLSYDALQRAIVWYEEDFRIDPLRTLSLKDENGNNAPALEVAFEIEIPGTGYSWKGIADRIAEDDEGIWVIDRKTTISTLTPTYFAQYDLDGQVDSYLWGFGEYLGVPLAGFLVEATQVGATLSRTTRYPVYRRGSQLNEWLENQKQWFRQAERYRAAGIWPYNDLDCRTCMFKDICSRPSEMHAGMLDVDFEKKTYRG